ncbi:MAG TPA: 1-acyl-sn-glycerol-3-phosphate acyltransferase, partial [Acidobacteriota bacterium]|nr:1-acyl-sn-glycerol-3-phosphate acyltransferase [Acidobacteriota bacterium]
MRCKLFIPIFVVATILMGLCSSLVSIFDRSGRISHHFARYWSRFIFWGVGIKTKVHGVENIPKDRAVIFAANHQST